MPSARPILYGALLILPLAGLSAQSAEEGVPRSWQKPAAAAADAATAQAPPAAPMATPAATAEQIVPPQPVPAKRLKDEATAATPKTTAPAAAPAAASSSSPVEAKVAPADAASKDAKESKDANSKVPKDAKDAKDSKDAAKDSKDTKDKKKVVAARDLFGAAKRAADLKPRAIGWYAKGCLAGGKALPIDGPAWQVMRLSRNRNWAHPILIGLLERFATEAQRHDGWPGLLVGDLAQPRGGPMTSGHASHQVGLDADIWLTAMPSRRFTDREREDIAATSMLAADEISVDPKVWTETHVKIIKRMASYAEVERVLVHPAIKKALCEAAGTDRKWLVKVRPYFGHYYHMHVRIGCPKDSTNCTAQAPPPGDDGCGSELKHWIKVVTPRKDAPPTKPSVTPTKPPPEKPPITLAQLPSECRAVLEAGDDKSSATATADAAAKAAKGETSAKAKSAAQQ